MRILLFANNWLGEQIAAWLKASGGEIVGLVVHPLETRKHGEEIIKAVGLDESFVLDGSRLEDGETLAKIQSLRPDIGISALFGYIMKRRVLETMPYGCINIHPAFLPYNRGAYPNVWSIIDNTPAGVTIHYIDEGVDTGDIIAQREVDVESVDTGRSLYQKLESASLELFKETWPLIAAGKAPRIAQSGGGTLHRARDQDCALRPDGLS